MSHPLEPKLLTVLREGYGRDQLLRDLGAGVVVGIGALGETEEAEEKPPDLRRREVPEGIEVFQIQGPLFFGATASFRDALKRMERPPRVLILRMRLASAIDATALHTFEEVVATTRRQGTLLLLSGLQPQPRAALERSGLLARIGTENVLPDVWAALERAKAVLVEEKPPNDGE
ncbi:MAG: sodium-independent anion transporter [Thermoanaerobaculia bacterium]